MAALIFDLDGTLVDSTESINRSWRKVCGELGLDPRAVVGRYHGMTGADTLRTVRPDLTAQRVAELNQQLIDGELDDLDGVRATPGARQALSRLPEGLWAIVTSCPRQLAAARLRAAGLAVPAVMVTAEDVEQGKPHPAPYETGARRLGHHPGDCLAVEDAPAGVASAVAAGCRVVAIATTHATPAPETVRDLAAMTFRAEAGGVRVSY